MHTAIARMIYMLNVLQQVIHLLDNKALFQ